MVSSPNVVLTYLARRPFTSQHHRHCDENFTRIEYLAARPAFSSKLWSYHVCVGGCNTRVASRVWRFLHNAAAVMRTGITLLQHLESSSRLENESRRRRLVLFSVSLIRGEEVFGFGSLFYLTRIGSVDFGGGRCWWR